MRNIIYSILDIIQVNSLNFCKKQELNFFNYFVVTKKNFNKKNFNHNSKKFDFLKILKSSKILYPLSKPPPS